MSWRSRAAFAISWLATLAFLSGGGASLAGMLLLLGGVALPCWLLLATTLRRAVDDEGLARLVAAASTLVLLAPLYLLRKAIPLPPLLADAVISALAWLGVWRTRAIGGGARVPGSPPPNATRAYLAILLPAAFCLTWLGYGVKGADSVRYLGLFYIDFGNLVSIENVVRASPLLPMSAVVDSGPLAYHWLFFAFPAWASEFAGLRGQGANALVMANFFTAALLYLALATACIRALRASALPVDARRLAPHLAAIGLIALSTLYGYQTVVDRLHLGRLAQGNRNSLLLQLPHSLTCFGNNTFALLLSVLVLELLMGWRSSGKRPFLLLAAGLTAVLPGYGILLVFPVGLAILAWSVSGQGRRPILTLATFGAFAAVVLVVFRGIGMFSSGSADKGMVVSFDGGQFVQNVVFGFFPATCALAICLWKRRATGTIAALSPYLSLLAACLVVPTMLVTRGSPTASVDFSMKTASLYLVAAVPCFAVAAAWLLSQRRHHAVLFMAGLALVAGGLANSGAYVFQHAVRRMLGRAGVEHAIPLDHHRALELVSRLPDRLIVIDELSVPSGLVDPAVMLGGKRVLVAANYDEWVFPPSAAANQNKATWLAWRDGGFTDQTLAARLAQRADLLITTSPVRSASWNLVASFGDVGVYRSTLRETLGRGGT